MSKNIRLTGLGLRRLDEESLLPTGSHNQQTRFNSSNSSRSVPMSRLPSITALLGRGKLRYLILFGSVYFIYFIFTTQKVSKFPPMSPDEYIRFKENEQIPIKEAEVRRRLVPPSDDPWAALDPAKSTQILEWLTASHQSTNHKVEMYDEVYKRPKASTLQSAFRWAARFIPTEGYQHGLSGSDLSGFGGQDGSIKYDQYTGRPLAVPHNELVFSQDKIHDSTFNILKFRPNSLKKVQWEGFKEREMSTESRLRREWVKKAFIHTWEGYKKHAWGHDELRPLSAKPWNGYNGWGATIFDTLDLLLIMGLDDEYNLARKHVESVDFTYLVPMRVEYKDKEPTEESLWWEGIDPQSLKNSGVEGQVTDKDEEAENLLGLKKRGPKEKKPMSVFDREKYASSSTIPTFETVIRYLGGLISAYELSLDPLMLSRAKELGDYLLPSLTTNHSLVIPRYTIGFNPMGKYRTGSVSLAEAGSLSMEFAKLSLLTGNNIYYEAVRRSMDRLDSGFLTEKELQEIQHLSRNQGNFRLGKLLPTFVDPEYPNRLFGEWTLGGLADSYYEYLIKIYQLLGGAEKKYKRMYEEAIDSVHKYLVTPVNVVPGQPDLITIGVNSHGVPIDKLEHLACFAGGTLALGSRLLSRKQDFIVGKQFTESCAWAYEATESGLGPESMVFYDEYDPFRYDIIEDPEKGQMRVLLGQPVGVKSTDSKYIGRPETIESVFYMYRITGDKKYQDIGWRMFVNWVEQCMTNTGFASLESVHKNTTLHPETQSDSQESFVLAETLKYYYLLFSPPDLISLDEWVFNTEAHPFKVSTPKQRSPVSFYRGTPPTENFVSSIGKGSFVQDWYRVLQASTLSKYGYGRFAQPGSNKNGGAGGGRGMGGGGWPKPEEKVGGKPKPKVLNGKVLEDINRNHRPGGAKPLGAGMGGMALPPPVYRPDDDEE